MEKVLVQPEKLKDKIWSKTNLYKLLKYNSKC